MKDIPIFTGQFGIATLILSEIPYKKTAYVMVRSVQPGKQVAFLQECRGFCRAAGADNILVTADEPLTGLPHIHDMLEYTCPRSTLPPPMKPVELVPVTAENADQYLALYNRLFYAIVNAATYTARDMERIVEQGSGWLALVGGEIAGLGELSDTQLLAIGVVPEFRGLGHRLALTLITKMECDNVQLRVSSINYPALRLYQKLGFDRTRVIASWYELTGQ